MNTASAGKGTLVGVVISGVVAIIFQLTPGDANVGTLANPGGLAVD